MSTSETDRPVAPIFSALRGYRPRNLEGSHRRSWSLACHRRMARPIRRNSEPAGHCRRGEGIAAKAIATIELSRQYSDGDLSAAATADSKDERADITS